MTEEISVKCLSCSNSLIIDEVYDTESYNDEIIEHSICYCSKCNKTYSVDIIYKFNHFELIEENE